MQEREDSNCLSSLVSSLLSTSIVRVKTIHFETCLFTFWILNLFSLILEAFFLNCKAFNN